MKRRTRLSVFAPLLAGSLALGPAAIARGAAPEVVPSATCTLSDVQSDGTVTITGTGFTPGQAFLSSPTAAGGSFTVGEGGSFTIPKREKAQYTISQGNDRTPCGGGGAAVGTTLKAGIVAGWEAVEDDCDATKPASANEQFSKGWDKGAAVAREAFC
ncbi:hypothetical protein [Streptomyces sp. NPDC090022]|uniref:hypothetical protein n=1 Tax=Streptomyces sp. NPDC090022 TaxID=3365920 RepID=UPI00380F447A